MLVGSAATLDVAQLFALLGIIVGGMIVAGLVVILGRHVLSAKSDSDSGGSLIRSWVAIALVMGLLVFCAAALYLPDTSTRSTMFGGLIASVGAAVAFYFSSKAQIRPAPTCSIPPWRFLRDRLRRQPSRRKRPRRAQSGRPMGPTHLRQTGFRSPLSRSKPAISLPG